MKRQKKQVKKEPVLSPMQAFDVPKVLKPKLFHLEMQGNEEMILDGCAGVLDYGEHHIKLHTGTWNILFTGNELSLQSYANGEAVIEGTVLSIQFEN